MKNYQDYDIEMKKKSLKEKIILPIVGVLVFAFVLTFAGSALAEDKVNVEKVYDDWGSGLGTIFVMEDVSHNKFCYIVQSGGKVNMECFPLKETK